MARKLDDIMASMPKKRRSAIENRAMDPMCLVSGFRVKLPKMFLLELGLFHPSIAMVKSMAAVLKFE
jgi:hypothetical protein